MTFSTKKEQNTGIQNKEIFIIQMNWNKLNIHFNEFLNHLLTIFKCAYG